MRGQSDLSAVPAVQTDRAPSFVADPASAEAAQKALVQDKSFQFTPLYPQPQAPVPIPDWLQAILNTLGELGPLALIVFWLFVGALGIGLMALLIRVILSQTYNRPGLTRLTGKEPEWRLSKAQAEALLADADALATQGLYAEAIHALLLRSIASIETNKPGLIRPALTSRDISRHPQIPDAARPAFSLLARYVEEGHFGGRPLDRGAFDTCREAWSRFALREVWT